MSNARVYTAALFEGIATITTHDDHSYDAYAKVTLDVIGPYVRWHGTFEVMGDDAPSSGGSSFIEFSDGRSGPIELQGVIDRKGVFHGRGTPPGFETIPYTPTAEVISMQPHPNAKFRRVLSNILFAGSAALITAGLWWEGKGWQCAGTGVIWMVMAITLSPRPQSTHSHMAPLEDDDDDK